MTTLPEHVREFLSRVESGGHVTDRASAFEALRPLGLEDFGLVLWNMPMTDCPTLSKFLPAMSSDTVTMHWTGSSGVALLQQSVAFVRSCAANYADICGETLRGKAILDFGCGYGRFLRLFSYFTNAMAGVDAWEQSLEQCRSSGLADVVHKSDAVPASLPLAQQFDFAFAFSVFTHLNKHAALASLGALRQSVKNDGLLAITIRPIEFWSVSQAGHLANRTNEATSMSELHRSSGFAFLPHADCDPKSNYGDTSLTVQWLENNIAGWNIVGVDRSLNDPLQLYVFLQAV
jgi:SAM-dependent methyltransferase